MSKPSPASPVPAFLSFRLIQLPRCPSATFEAQTRNEIAKLGGNKDFEAIMDFLLVDDMYFG